MTVAELVRKSRSIRRFVESERISEQTLRELVDLARLSPTGGNKQPLKFLLVSEPGECAKMFPLVAWAGALTDWPGPAEGERPAAYLAILLDKGVSEGAGVNHGIAAQSIALGACEKGIGCCMMGAIQRPKIKSAFDIPDQYDVLLVLALGKPAEKVLLDPLGLDGDTDYWRDEQSVHHVPKRSLDEVIVRFG